MHMTRCKNNPFRLGSSIDLHVSLHPKLTEASRSKVHVAITSLFLALHHIMIAGQGGAGQGGVGWGVGKGGAGGWGGLGCGWVGRKVGRQSAQKRYMVMLVVVLGVFAVVVGEDEEDEESYV